METLPDPCNDRKVAKVPLPYHKPPPDQILFKKKSKGTDIPDPNFMQDFLRREGRLSKEQTEYILKTTTRVL